MQDLSADPTILYGPENAPQTLAFSQDGQWLATGSLGNTVRLYYMQDLSADPIILQGYGDSISTLIFSQDSQWLAAGSSDNAARLWNMQDLSADPIILYGHRNAINTLAFSQDGQWLATGSWDETVRLWNLNTDHWLKTACQVVGRNFTRIEWEKYFPNDDYRKTCEQWPLEQPTATATP